MSPPFPSLAERGVGVERGKVLTSDRRWGLGRKPVGLRWAEGSLSPWDSEGSTVRNLEVRLH